jgi:phosphoribosylformylglycinamidine cyclo-ligase
MTVGKLLLSPTRTYAPVIGKVLDTCRGAVHGMVHVSGGGQTKVSHFLDAGRVVKDNLFPLPPLFALIREMSGAGWREMYQVFNMGHRMELYLEPSAADAVMRIAEGFGVEARLIGRVEPGPKAVVIRSPHGEFLY